MKIANRIVFLTIFGKFYNDRKFTVDQCCESKYRMALRILMSTLINRIFQSKHWKPDNCYFKLDKFDNTKDFNLVDLFNWLHEASEEECKC